MCSHPVHRPKIEAKFGRKQIKNYDEEYALVKLKLKILFWQTELFSGSHDSLFYRVSEQASLDIQVWARRSTVVDISLLN